MMMVMLMEAEVERRGVEFGYYFDSWSKGDHSVRGYRTLLVRQNCCCNVPDLQYSRVRAGRYYYK